MGEHVPPRALVALMALFFSVMTLCALTFWLASLVLPGGVQGVIALIGFGAMTIFRHVPHSRGDHGHLAVALGTSPAAPP